MRLLANFVPERLTSAKSLLIYPATHCSPALIAMQTLWQYFRISMTLVAASAILGVLATLGVDNLEKRKPPEAIELKAIDSAWSDHRFNIRADGPRAYRFDLELEARDVTLARLCDPVPPVTAIKCDVPAGRIGIEWRLENDNHTVVAAGNLKTAGSLLHFGSFHWLELGRALVGPGKHLLRLRNLTATEATDLPWARIRIWRGARDNAEASEEARRTSNWIFATVCTLLLALFAIMLEYVVWKRQRAPR